MEDHFAREGQKVLFLGVNNVEVTITALVDVHSRRRKRSELEDGAYWVAVLLLIEGLLNLLEIDREGF